MFYARLIDNNGCARLFEILGYKDGKYMVYIDFVFPMQLSKIVYRSK